MGVGETTQHRIISHTLIRITPDEIHETILAFVEQFLFFLFFSLFSQALSILNICKMFWDFVFTPK